MGGLVVFALMVLVIIVLASAAGGSGYNAIVRKGVPARGIFLQVASTATKAPGSTPQRRLELRQVLIDVEIPGEAPYQVNAIPYIPSNLARDVLPGATVELRVMRNNRARIAVVGPGAGFAVAQLNAGQVIQQGLS